MKTFGKIAAISLVAALHASPSLAVANIIIIMSVLLSRSLTLLEASRRPENALVNTDGLKPVPRQSSAPARLPSM